MIVRHIKCSTNKAGSQLIIDYNKRTYVAKFIISYRIDKNYKIIKYLERVFLFTLFQNPLRIFHCEGCYFECILHCLIYLSTWFIWFTFSYNVPTYVRIYINAL